MNNTDYKAICLVQRDLLEQMKKRNKELTMALTLYANGDWMDIPLLDRGDAARDALGCEVR